MVVCSVKCTEGSVHAILSVNERLHTQNTPIHECSSEFLSRQVTESVDQTQVLSWIS
jgi:hypothetical protein